MSCSNRIDHLHKLAEALTDSHLRLMEHLASKHPELFKEIEQLDRQLTEIENSAPREPDVHQHNSLMYVRHD